MLFRSGLVRDYETLIVELLVNMTQKNYPTAVKLASLPEQIRGFGHVKERNVAAVSLERNRLLQQFRSGNGVEMAA